VLDPRLPFNLPAFIVSDVRFPVIYELKEVVGGVKVAINPQIMVFDADTLSGTLAMHSDNSLVGVYTYELSARYDIPINYKAA
jgi:hypothetical protein